MGLGQETRKAIAATVGVVDWLAQQANEVWQQRDRWGEQLSGAYDDLVDRGDARLNRVDAESRRQASRAGQAARRVPGVPAAEGEVRGLTDRPDQLPITDYDRHNADEIVRRLTSLSQRELHEVEGYEATHQARTTVLRRIDDLRGEEPWPTYDEMNVDEVVSRLRELPVDQRPVVARYEQRHRNRRTILDATARS